MDSNKVEIEINLESLDSLGPIDNKIDISVLYNKWKNRRIVVARRLEKIKRIFKHK